MRRLASILAVVTACSSPPRPHAPPPTPPPAPPATPVVTREPPAAAADAACKPPEPPKPTPPDDDTGGDNPGGPRDRLAHGKTTCDVADDNLARDEAAILAQPAQPVVAPHAYDHKGALAALPIVERRFTLQPDELARLRTTGAVVPARLELTSFAQGYHEIFQSQLPVYITADSIFQAIFASHDDLVSSLETGYGGPTLAGTLDAALDAMHCALPAASADYPPEVARDLDLYLTVARDLSATTPIHAKLDGAVDREAAALVAQIVRGDQLAKVSLFGRDRLVDFTQFQPRGHYATDQSGQPLPEDAAERHYFRAAMWASRLELNLVSRSSRSSAPGPEPDPSETPREALDALALADLAAKSGADAQIAKLDHAWALLAGKREDVSIAQLASLRVGAKITSLRDPGAFAALKAAIGDGYQRTTRIHPMPEGSRVLPAIATLIGPRIVADAQAIMPIVHSAVPDRQVVGAADIAYILGFDRAKPYLAGDLAKYPALDAQLAVARTGLAAFPRDDDLYGAWLGAIRGLAVDPRGQKPSYLASDVGRDLRLDSIATAYGQLKHNYVLMAGQPYSEFGCEIPDGYVEPVPDAFDGLIIYARRGAQLATILDPDDKRHLAGYYKRVERVLAILRTIVAHELAGSALSPAEQRWLGSVAEMSQDRSADVTGYPPMYTGWYFDLFYGREDNALRAGSFVADYFTSAEAGVAYLGASAPRMGIFVVDAGGVPRVMVGPVARGYERHEPIGTRLTDDVATAKLTKLDEAWAASYTIAAAAPRPSTVRVTVEDTARPQEAHPKATWTPNIAMTIATDRALGTATVKLLDHHRVPFATKKVKLGDGETKLAWGKQPKQVGAVYVEVGAFHDVIVADAYDQLDQAGWGGPQ